MSSARSPYLRSEWYDAMRLDPYIDNLLSERSISVHDARRAKMSLGYSGKENPFLEPDIDACIGALVALIRRKYLSAGDAVRPADVGRMAHFLTLDIITKVAYGEAFGFIEGDRDVHEYIRTSEEVVGWITLFAVVPAAQRFINRGWVRRNFGPGPGDKKGIGKLMGVAEKVVAERFGPDAKVKADMLGAFVRNGIPKRQIQAEVLLQIVAGSDTTATAIRATMLYLASNHRAMTKLRKEIDEAESEGRISHPISNAQAKKLPYLQAVIKEGLRIHPPFTGLVMKEVPPQGDTIEGQFVPGGTKVGLSLWAMMRDPMFGEDVEVFRPERWIEADGERYTKMEQTVELVFGYGRWVCLGKTVALIELNKVFVEVSKETVQVVAVDINTK
ncbi:cytochrome P450 [Corynespora cassiicola Philippines]|uniref:Cytochrome P450 n=1 Tax=Corynespora cassiicola Philippines TaxID=1448308 RepID=A0A2T2NMX0_CORCC|nr:cytochrome P450 [Corynespora cassiicola Philippines]